MVYPASRTLPGGRGASEGHDFVLQEMESSGGFDLADWC